MSYTGHNLPTKETFAITADRHILGTHPKPDESLVSFVFRLAKRRDMPTAWTLARQVGFASFGQRPRDEVVAKLANVANVEVIDLKKIFCGQVGFEQVSFLGRKIPKALLKGHVQWRRVCPACLTENAYHRAVWDLSFVSTCPTHRCQMVEACPACGRDLRWTGNDLSKCGCGADLSMAPTISASADLMDGIAAAYGLLGVPSFASEAMEVMRLLPLHDLAPIDALEFIYRVGMDVTPGIRRKLFSLEHPGKLDELPHIALHRGLQVALRWPDAFDQVPLTVARIWGRKTSKVAGIWRGAVGRWLNNLPPTRGMEIRRVVSRKRQTK